MEYVKRKIENESRVTWIDSLKGIAVCGVVWVHSGGGNLGNLFDPLGKAGAYWVQMLFILTVYLSCHSLKNRLEACRKVNNRTVFLQWFLERVWKLTPLYYFMLLMYLMIVPEGANIWLGLVADRPSGLNVLTHLLYLHSLFPYYANSIMWVEWYLGVMFLYLILTPFAYQYIRQSKSVVAFSIVIVIMSVLATFVLSYMHPTSEEYIWEGWVYTYSFIVHLPALAFGILFFYLERIYFKNRTSKVMCGFSIAGYVFLSYLGYYTENRFLQVSKIAGFSLVFLLFILSKKMTDNYLLNNRMWRIIGRNSYAIYLCHYLLIFVGDYFINDDLVANVLCSPLLWQVIKCAVIILSCLFFSIVYDKIIGGRMYIWGKRKISEFFA